MMKARGSRMPGQGGSLARMFDAVARKSTTGLAERTSRRGFPVSYTHLTLPTKRIV